MWRLLFVLASAVADVVSVVEACRHGARSPLDVYAWDQGVWPQGLGELTPEGMRMHYLNGVEFRSRYAGTVFSDTFYSSQIYVRSTDVNRTIMSAQSQLDGLFPLGPTLNSTQVANAVPPMSVQNLSAIQNTLGLVSIQGQYQPVPIHVMENQYDHVLVGYKPEVCPAIAQIMNEVQNSPDYLAREASYNASVKAQVEQVFNTSNVSFCDAGWIADAVACDLAAGFGVPAGLTDELYAQISAIDSYCNSYEFTEEGARLASSEFFKIIIKNFDLAITGMTDLRFSLYSAHDTTLAGFLSGLRVFNNKNPPFASTLLFELHNEGAIYYVKVIYNDTPQIIPGCDVVMCPYTVFRGILESQTYQDIEAACQAS